MSTSQPPQPSRPSTGDGKPAADDGSGAAEPAAGFRIGGEEPADEQGHESPPSGTPAPTDAGPAD